MWYAASAWHRPAFGRRRRRRRPSRARCAHRSKRRGAHGALQFVVPLTSQASGMFRLGCCVLRRRAARACRDRALRRRGRGRRAAAAAPVARGGGGGDRGRRRRTERAAAGRPTSSRDGYASRCASQRGRRSRSFGSLRATVPHRSCAAGCGGPIVSDRRLDVHHMIDHMTWHDVPFQAGPAGRSSATCAAASRARPSTPRRRTSGRCSRSSTPASEVGTATAAVCRRCVGRRVEECDRAREGVDVAKPGAAVHVGARGPSVRTARGRGGRAWSAGKCRGGATGFVFFNIKSKTPKNNTKINTDLTKKNERSNGRPCS